MTFLKAYLKNILIWIDQGINVVFFFGDPDETISSRVGKAYRRGEGWAGVARSIIDEFFGPNHCVESIEEDEGDKI